MTMNQQYKEQKKLELIGSKISFKQWINNLLKKDIEQKDSNPNEPTDYSNKKMKLHILGINAYAFAGIMVGLGVIFFTARYYYLKNRRAAS